MRTTKQPKEDSPSSAAGFGVKRLVLPVVRFCSKKGSGWLLIPIILALIALFFWAIRLLISPIQDGIWEWWQSIEDPTERGCAYIATAIAAHVVIMTFKNFSCDKIKVSLKK